MNFKYLVMILCFLPITAFAGLKEDTSIFCDRVVEIVSPEQYVLKCLKRPEFLRIKEQGNKARLYFTDPVIADNLLQDDRYLYIHVLTQVPDPGFEDQTCYRFVREFDNARNGYYAVQECEFNTASGGIY